MSKEIKNTLLMGAFALVFGIILAGVHQVTAGPIALQHEMTLKAAYQAVVPEASDFEDMNIDLAEADSITLADYNAQITSVLDARNESGESVGYVVNVTSHGGYGGDIVFSMGIDGSGAVEGVSITEIDETPGLGMKATSDPSFLAQYTGQEAGTVYALGDNIQSITSATFTSRCINYGINAGVAYYREKIGGGQ